MAMTFAVLADVAASVTGLKKDPMGTLREAKGETVVILNRNEPAFYAVPPDRYEAMMDVLDDLHLAEIVKERLHHLDDAEEVSIEELERSAHAKLSAQVPARCT